MSKQYFSYGLVIAVVLTGFASTASANQPQKTTATYSDWLVQCRSYKAPKKAAAKKEPGIADRLNVFKKAAPTGKKICEMVQTFTFRRSGRQLAKLAIGQLPGKSQIKAVIQTPLAVYLPEGVVIKAGPKGTEKIFRGKFVRCTKTSCFAEIDMTKEDSKVVENAKAVSLLFVNSARNKLSLSVSLKGYGDAFRAALARSN